MSVTALIELHDSDILALERGPLAWMQSHQGKSVPLEPFRQECQHRFAEAGFAVDVIAYETSQLDLYGFEVSIVGRTSYSTKFDPDQQSWEVAHNILALPDKQEGWIPVDKGMAAALRDHRPTQHLS